MKPTKEHIKGVKETIKMWKWLRRNPDKNKEDYLNAFVSTYDWPMCHCYLCRIWLDFQFCVGNIGNKLVINCPLGTGSLCCARGDDNSGIGPFRKWERSTDNDFRKIQCTSIISACNRWLKKYGIK